MCVSTNSTRKPYHHLWLLLVLLANLIVGVCVVRDYGESRDEQSRIIHAERSLAAYTREVRAKGMTFYIMMARCCSCQACTGVSSCTPTSTSITTSLQVVWGADHIVKNYARDDLDISQYRKASNNPGSLQDYAVISTRHNKDLSLYSGAPVLFQVSRDGAVFVVVKRLGPQNPPQP